MRLSEIVEIIGGKVVCGDNLEEQQVEKAFATDLMSDVLTLEAGKILLITGLNHLQTLRTAEMAEIYHIVIVRNKKPSKEFLALAKREKMTIILSEKSLYSVSGALYKNGLEPVY